MGAKCSLMIDKMMRRMLSNKLRACLCQVVLGVALLGALYGCRMDHPNPSEQGEEGKSIMLDMNLGEIEIDPETIINYVSTSTERGIEMTTPSSDTDAQGRRLHPTFGFADTGKAEEDFPVFIALFGQRQKVDCYGRATWKLVKEEKDGKTRYFVRTKAPITFEAGAAPDESKLKNGETWQLHAIYAPNGTWDATSASYKWKAQRVVKKLYGPNEKLKIGEDIDIPFVLGYRLPNASSPSGSDWITGYPVKAVKSTSWNFEVMQQYEDPNAQTKKPLKPRFRMLGSLMAIRLHNTWTKHTPLSGLDMDETIMDGLTYRPTYDFSIKGFAIESTQGVTEVKYSFKSLYMDLTPEKKQNLATLGKAVPEDAVRWVSVPGATVTETPATTPTLSDPTHIAISLTSNKNDASGEALDRSSTSKTLYFWMSEVDPTGTRRPNKDERYGTVIWADLYNKTIKMYAGSTFVYTASSAHKSGYAYRSVVPLKEELYVNPLARMGLRYIAGDPNSGNCYFARETADNDERPFTNPNKPGDTGAGQPYTYSGGAAPYVRDFEGKRFKVQYIKDDSPQRDGTRISYYGGDLNWEVPDRFDIYSVFPYVPKSGIPEFGGLLYKKGTNEYLEDNKVHRATGEEVRIDGVRYKGLKSIYYRKDAQSYRRQTYALATNVFFAFRFIGTKMAVAVRYTEGGKWYNPNWGSNTYNVPVEAPYGGSTKIINPHSYFQIDMKPIGNAYNFKNMTDDEAEKYLREQIAQDSFWQDGTELRPEVLSRRLHVNGVWSGNAVNDWNIDYGGQAIFLWLRQRSDQYSSAGLKKPYPGVYQNHRMDNDSWHFHIASQLEIGENRGYFILPWLSMYQGNED